MLVSPSAAIAQGIYDDRVVITSTNHVPYAYNVQVTVTSSAVGSVMFDVINEFYEDVPNASITLQHQSVLDLVYNLKTAPDGMAMLTDIPEGRYSYNVSAANHLARSGSFIVTPGMTSSVAIALEVNLVNVEWSVVPTTIVDKYDIRISQTFATNVPAPVLIAEPAGITVPQLQPGEVFNGEFKVTNYGLIAVYEVALEFPTSHRDYDIEVMRDAVPTRLEAMQSVVIPYRITRRATALAAYLNGGVVGNNGLPPNAAAGGNGANGLYACARPGTPSPNPPLTRGDTGGSGWGEGSSALLKYGSLFDEVRGYGGSCFETIGIILSGKYVICPNSPASSVVTKAVNFALSFIADCVLGPIASAADLFYGTSNAVGAQSGPGTVSSPLAGTTYCGPGPGCTKPPCACPPPEPVSNDACMAYKCEGTSYVQFWKQGCKPPDKCNPWTPQCTGCNPGCQTSDNPCIITACENGVCKPRWKKGCVPPPCMPWSTASYCKTCSPACVDDGDPCTKTYCNNGTCEHVPIEGCTRCKPDGSCSVSANPCVNNRCVGGVCTEFWKKGCDPCERKNADGTDALTFSPEHCKSCDPVCTDDDNDACTQEICYDGDCKSMPIEGCRTCQEGCDDKDACTTDACNTTTGLCENTSIPDCQRCEPDGPIENQPCKECSGGKITDKADGTCATGGKACIKGTAQDVALASVNLLVNERSASAWPNGVVTAKVNDSVYFRATVGEGANCSLDENAVEWYFSDDGTRTRGSFAMHEFATADTHPVTVNAGCKCNPGATAGAGVSVKVDKGSVKVLTADIPTDTIEVELSPAGLSGNLKVELIGGTNYIVKEGAYAAGTHTFSFDIPRLGNTVMEYTSVRATWTVDNADIIGGKTYKIKVLGKYRISQYRIVTESACGTTPTTTACIPDAQCNFAKEAMSKPFACGVLMNGTGKANNGYYYSWGNYCENHGHTDADCWLSCPLNSAYLTLDKGASPTGRYARAQGTVAVYDMHPDIYINDRVYIHTLGVRDVTDYCEWCNDITHLDHFIGEDGGCMKATDVPGNPVVIKLY